MSIKQINQDVGRKSLRTTLLFAVAGLIIISSVIISQLVIHRYSKALLNSAAITAENISHNLALDAADKVLINDLVALQKMLDDQMTSESAIAYLFITQNGRVLTHTFSEGVPIELINANSSIDNQSGHLEKIIDKSGKRYLDIAWPIFEGKGGIIRLGLYEKPYRRQVQQLWFRMSVITLCVLIAALWFTRSLINRLLGPLTLLTDAVETINEENMEMQIAINGRSEVTKLANAFNQMLQRLKEFTDRLNRYSQKLEKKNAELDRAHHQLTTSLSISQQIASFSNLKEMCRFLIQTLKKIVTCDNILMVILSHNQKAIFLLKDNHMMTLDHGLYKNMSVHLNMSETFKFIETDVFSDLSMSEFAYQAKRSAVFPLRYQGRPIGGLLVACPGECHCIEKELEVIHLLLNQTSGAINRALSHEEELRELRLRTEVSAGFDEMVGKDKNMQVVYKLIEDVAPTDATVLIQGESGTGKEMVARAIHRHSGRSKKPFVVINCSAYPAALLESELFGHEKGAFTGAVRSKPGRFEQANGGTVFLDEIGEISASAQIKLLRILQSRKFERVGGETVLTADIRILAATNRILANAVKNGEFREDLYYRVNVIPIHLPPLRERRNDIPALAIHFLEKYAAVQSKEKLKEFSSESMRKLLEYAWPGNVRELENSIEHAVVLAKGEIIEATDLPATIFHDEGSSQSTAHQTVSETEKELIWNTLDLCEWNKTEAAARLGISRSTLYEKLKKYRIQNPTIH